MITSQPVGLPMKSFEQRMEQAIRARFNEDLEPLFADLPRTVEPVAEQKSNRPSEAHLAWSAMVWLAPVFISAPSLPPSF